MRILFTGGGSGGHFYPIIAVAESLRDIVKEKHLLEPELFYLSTNPYNPGLLFENGITFKKISAGKLRRYFSVLNFLDLFKTLWGVLLSLWEVYKLYPDVIFGKGGYVSFPVLFAARILRVPVIIHESDSIPGRVNLWAGKFAQKIALSWPDAAKFFGDKNQDKIALTGNPVRKDIETPITEGSREFLHIEKDIPVVLVLGGSLGSEIINDILIEGLPALVEKYAIIHQTGKKNIEENTKTGDAVLFGSEHKDRYKPFDYLNALAMRMSAGVASVVVSRAGSTIFEIAAWGVPSIIVPIGEQVSHDQKSNAFAYARTGACEVIEEDNLTAHVLSAEIDRLMTNQTERQKMIAATRAFYKPNASHEIAEEILKIALSHEVEK
ncbi:MAG: UDP-N-acetylglucosamine--N-acetylmuramyl-(pentapeptide) pyrophosphoryl-undecaprenol N-acetylglucosamine transferase [Minisyncoccota bacterium]